MNDKYIAQATLTHPSSSVWRYICQFLDHFNCIDNPRYTPDMCLLRFTSTDNMNSAYLPRNLLAPSLTRGTQPPWAPMRAIGPAAYRVTSHESYLQYRHHLVPGPPPANTTPLIVSHKSNNAVSGSFIRCIETNPELGRQRGEVSVDRRTFVEMNSVHKSC